MNDQRLSTARELDAADELAGFRDRFHLPKLDDEPVVYLCGNSLGLQPKSTAAYVQQELDDWKRLGVEGHLHAVRPWLPYHENLTRLTGELVGALPVEIVSMNTLTVNLHLFMVSFYRPTNERYRILIEKPAFPSDRYAVVSQIRFHGYDPDAALLEIGPREGESAIRDEDILELIEREGASIALILFAGVQYYGGQLFDMPEITRLGHEKGCQVGFDLAHAAGNIPLQLHDWNVDFACWCSYKYLNAGPGAVAGCFVHERHGREFDGPRFSGWWGHNKATRFQMGPHYLAIPGAEGWQISNPPILSLAPVLASLEIFHEAGIDALRAKSVGLTGYLEALLRERLHEHIDVLTPTEPDRRGCQLSLRVRHGTAVGRNLFDALHAQAVICDWREPDVIRVAPVPLYNTFDDVARFVAKLAQLLANTGDD